MLSVKTKLAAVALPVAALILGAAGSASAATAAHAARGQATSAAAAPLAWHRLTLINGWHTIQYKEIDNPAYAIRDGVVYLTGALHQPAAGSAEFAVLPKAARPAHAIFQLVDTSSTIGWLKIGTDGSMQALNADQGQAQFGTFLTGVSYLAAGSHVRGLNLIHGWASGQNPYQTGSPGYAIRGGVVYLSGSIQQTSGSNIQFAVLPKAARPARELFIADYMAGGAQGTLIIKPNGNIFATSNPQGFARTFTSLAAIAFPARGAAWHKLPLINGWTSGQSSSFRTGGPAYTIINGVEYLGGSVKEPHGSQFFFATTPRSARPAHEVSVPVVTWGGSINSVTLAPNGKTFFLSVPASTRHFTALTGMSFPLNN